MGHFLDLYSFLQLLYLKSSFVTGCLQIKESKINPLKQTFIKVKLDTQTFTHQV